MDGVRAEHRQQGYDVRLEWGREGAAVLARECASVVVIDVLSFSTAVDVALGRGARILPLPWRDEWAARAARAAGAVLGGERSWTLRPSSLLDIPAGTLLALSSVNGATLCRRAQATGARVFVGCLRNARAVAAAAAAAGGPVGVIAAGEQWDVPGRPVRPGLEDYLGAGAIVAAMPGGSWSPEARLAAEAARAVDDVPAMVTDCTSGRELAEWGHEDDVVLATECDVSAVAPVLVNGVLTGD